MKNSNRISLAFGTKIIVSRVLDSISIPICMVWCVWDDLMSSRVSQKLINENKNENISKKTFCF